MDIKVYQKEEVKQPKGTEYVFVPNIIDLIPEEISKNDEIYISGCVELEDDSAELLEQQCALATIWQRGLDPLDLESGIEWSEALLDEINVLQLMEDIQNAVAEVSNAVSVVFDTVTDAKGNQFLTYKIQGVA